MAKKSTPKPAKKQEPDNVNESLVKSYRALFNYFNTCLFEQDGELLPECVLTWTHNVRHAGTFWHSGDGKGLWCLNKDEDNRVFEINLNPQYAFKDKTGRYACQVLVHEMVHLWQTVFGKSSASYHNAQFADKMEVFGLICSATGQKGGRRTGRSMTEYVVEGKFTEAFDAMPNHFFDWKHKYFGPSSKVVKKKNKVKYVCPGVDCDLTVWGKPGLSQGGKLFCFECDSPLDERG